MPTPTGRYAQIDGAPVVRFERTFPHPTDAVWDAITDPPQLQRWFPTTVEFERLAPGAPIAFRFADDAHAPLTGEIREVQPPHRLAFTWGEDLLSFELAEHDGGAACRLSFTVVLDAADKAARDSAGWDSCLDMLDTVAGGGIPDGAAGAGDWEAYYRQYQALGLPATAEIPVPRAG